MPPPLIGVPLFAILSPDELQQLLAKVQRRTYRADEAIFREGDPPAFVYHILSGEVNLSLASEERRISLGQLVAGDLLGIMSIFDDGPQFLSATATIPTMVLAIPREEVLAILRGHPEMIFRMVAILSRQVRAAALLVADMQFVGLPVRLAKRILERAEQFASGDREPVDVKITQEELSELTGATRGGVNRALKRLEELGVIRTGRGRLTILALDRLQQVAQQGPLPMILSLSRLSGSDLSR